VVNVSATDAAIVYGIHTTGVTSLSVSSSDAIRGSTINASGTTNDVRGILSNGANRFSCRDTNVYASGTSPGGDAVAIETIDPAGILQMKTSTLSGTTYDIARPIGQILLQATDLVHGTTDGNSFDTSTNPSNVSFGLVGNISTGTKQLIPGTISNADLTGANFLTPFYQTTVVIRATFKVNIALVSPQVVTFNLYKNSSANPPFMTATLNSTTSSVIITNISETFTTSDSLIVNATVSGASLGSNNVLYCDLGLY
jgi:hypothetical protein